MILTSKKLLLLILSLVGILISSYLIYIRYTSTHLICGNFGDCEKVQYSEYAQLFGIPMSVLGLVYYITLLALVLVKNTPLETKTIQAITTYTKLSSELAKYTLNHLLILWIIWGILFSLYLTYLEVFVIEAICIWCVSSFANILAAYVVYSIGSRRF